TLDLAHQLQAVLARQLDVDETEVRRLLVVLLDALGARVRCDGQIPVRSQKIHQDHLIHRIVLDDQDLLHLPSATPTQAIDHSPNASYARFQSNRLEATGPPAHHRARIPGPGGHVLPTSAAHFAISSWSRSAASRP